MSIVNSVDSVVLCQYLVVNGISLQLSEITYLNGENCVNTTAVPLWTQTFNLKVVNSTLVSTSGGESYAVYTIPLLPFLLLVIKKPFPLILFSHHYVFKMVSIHFFFSSPCRIPSSQSHLLMTPTVTCLEYSATRPALIQRLCTCAHMSVCLGCSL